MAQSREIPTADESNTEESNTVESSETVGSSEESDSEPEPEPAKKAPAAALAKADDSSESESESVESSEESDSKPEPEPAKKAPATALAKADDSSESESESVESSEESDSEPEPEPAKKAPAAALAKADAPEEDSSESESESVESSEEESFSAVDAKNPAPASRAADGKLSSGKKGAVSKNVKKLFVRIFTPEDEIILLEELARKYPKEPSEMDGFFEYIKARISASVSKAQVRSKIRKLRLKYFGKRKKEAANKKKEKKRGSNNEEGKKKDDLELKAYELSDRIWGNQEMPKGKFASHVCDGRSTEEWVFGEGKELLDEETRGELEREWKLLRKEETGILVKRLELSCKHAKLVCDAMVL